MTNPHLGGPIARPARRQRPVSLLALVAVGAFVLACAGGEPPPVEEDVPDLFASPDMVEVQPGDSLSKIAQREGCTVDELIAWNGLTTDVIEPGQILLVWESKSGSRAKPKTGADRDPREVEVAAAHEPEPQSWNPLRRLVAPRPSPRPAPQAAPGAPAPVAAAQPERAAPTPSPRPAPLLVRGAGILGIDLGGSDEDLAASARAMEKHESDLDKSGLQNRGGGLDAGGEADTFEVERRLDDNYGGVQIPNTPVKPPRLSKPAARRCLAGPTDADLRSDQDMVGNASLTEAQIRSGMSKVVRASAQCFPRGTVGTYSVVAELSVGCDGRVQSARMISTGVVPGHVTSCITTTLEYAGFAAHATPDGVVFQYPLEYSF